MTSIFCMIIWARRGNEGQGWVRKQLRRIQLGGGRVGVNSRQPEKLLKAQNHPCFAGSASLWLKLQAFWKEPVFIGNWLSWAFWAPLSQVVVYRAGAPGWACNTLGLTPNNLIWANHSKIFAKSEWSKPSMWFHKIFNLLLVFFLSLKSFLFTDFQLLQILANKFQFFFKLRYLLFSCKIRILIPCTLWL